MATAATLVFRNQVKPVGEIIPISLVRQTQVANPDRFDYDFIINADYVLTGLDLSKTVGAQTAAYVTTVTVYKFYVNAAGVEVETPVAVAVMPALAPKGTKIISGISAGSLIYADAAGTAADPLIKIKSQKADALGSLTRTQQRLRVSVSIAGAIAGVTETSCFIQLHLARFQDVPGLQGAELFKVAP